MKGDIGDSLWAGFPSEGLQTLQGQRRIKWISSCQKVSGLPEAERKKEG